MLPIHSRCWLCRQPLRLMQQGICSYCLRTLPAKPCCCPVCGLPSGDPHQPCGRCLQKAPPWQALVFVADYRPPISTLVKNFKFQQTPALAPTLARLILLHWLQAHREQHLNRPEVILAVPLQDKRCWRRGYNQSELLALPLARWLGCEYRPAALRRIRATAPQQKLIAAYGGVICVVLSVVMRTWQGSMWHCWMMWLPLAAPWQKSLHYYRSKASHRCRFGAFAARCSTTAMGVL